MTHSFLLYSFILGFYPLIRCRGIELPEIGPFVFQGRVPLGQKAIASCIVTSSAGAIEFKWRINGKEVGNSSNLRIKHDKDYSTIVIDPVMPESEGNYTCVAKNSLGSNSFTAELLVEASPQFTNEPYDVSTALGDSVELHCSAFGSPLPRITWKRIADSLETLKAFISNNGTLSIKNITRNDAGSYECEANNGIQPSITKRVKITVRELPKIKPFSFNGRVGIGEKALASCLVISSSGQLLFSWLKNGVEIAEMGTDVRIKHGTDFSLAIIDPVQLSSEGNYTCVVKSEAYTSSYTAELLVDAPPVWIDEPQDQNIILGTSLVLACAARGSPVPQTKWRKLIDTSVKDLTEYTIPNGTLIVPNTSENDSGVYQCEAANTVKPSLIKEVRIVIYDVPVIKPFSFNERVPVGQKTSTTCFILSSNGPFTFKWLKDGKEITETPEVKTTHHKEYSLIIISPVTLTSRGNYSCVASNSFGSSTFTTSLQVEAPPEWIEEPQDVYSVMDATIYIHCSSRGSPLPQTHWVKITGKTRESPETVPKEMVLTNGTMIIEKLSEESAGVYECEVDNGVKPSLKKRISVIVYDSIAIEPFSFPRRTALGQKTTATCLVSSGIAVDFTWLRNGRDVSDSPEIRVKNGNDYSLIIIDPVDIGSGGNYTCVVNAGNVKASYTAQLVIEAPPSWELEPDDSSVISGDNAILHCKAMGSPQPEVSWHKIIDGSKNSKSLNEERISSNGTLIMKNVTSSHSGTYVCLADNGVQPSLEKQIILTVHVPAKFQEKFSVVTARKGESAKLRCEAIGDQPVSIVWSKEQIKLNKAGGTRYEIFETLLPKGMVSELIIRSSDREDGALYTCVAENQYGQDERKTRLLVMEVPAPPLDVKVRDVWSRSCSISWSPPYSGNSPITKYIIQYWRDQGSGHRLHEKEVPSTQSTSLIKDLHPGTSYILKIVAENTVGRGDSSASVIFQTGEEEPNAPPVDIAVESGGSSTIKVTWKPPPKDNWNGQLKGYYIGYKTVDSSQPYSYKTVVYIPNRTQEYFLTNLLKATDYSVVVKAYNSAGGGPASQEVIVRTLDGDLPSPPSVFVLSTSPSTVTLRWNANRSDNPVTGYTIYCKEEHGEWQEVPIHSVDDNTYTLSNLLSGRTYHLYISASNQYGRGDPSEVIAVRTEHGALLTSAVGGANPPYMELAVLVPVAASLCTIVVVICVACICVRKIRKRQHMERAIAAGKHMSLPGTIQRYVDVDKARPLVQGDPNNPEHYPSPYATMPMMDEVDMNNSKECLNELKTFCPQVGIDVTNAAKLTMDRPVYPKPSSLSRKQDHIYDSPQ